MEQASTFSAFALEFAEFGRGLPPTHPHQQARCLSHISLPWDSLGFANGLPPTPTRQAGCLPHNSPPWDSLGLASALLPTPTRQAGCLPHNSPTWVSLGLAAACLSPHHASSMPDGPDRMFTLERWLAAGQHREGTSAPGLGRAQRRPPGDRGSARGPGTDVCRQRCRRDDREAFTSPSASRSHCDRSG